MLNVLYQFNEKYVPYAATSMVSLLENNKLIDEITIYVLGEELTRESQYKLREQVNKYGRKIVMIDSAFLVQTMKELKINDYRGSYATNMKMFVTDFIPDTVKRLLYIDSDTLVVGELKQLEYFDMNKKPIAMVQDSLCKNHKKHLGFLAGDEYFNGGVILYDMERWRDLKCTERICEHLRTQRCHYMAPDQDLINIVLKGEIARLDIQYNIQPMHSVYQYKIFSLFWGQSAYYTEEEVQDALENPIIFHTFRYLGEFPWHEDNLHPNQELFDKYINMSLWRGYKKQPAEKNDFIFRIERRLYRILPNTVFIVIFKLCYEIFIWKSDYDSKMEKNNARM